MSRKGNSIAQDCVLGLNSNREGPINVCLKVNRYKDKSIIRTTFPNGIIVSVN